MERGSHNNGAATGIADANLSDSIIKFTTTVADKNIERALLRFLDDLGLIYQPIK